MFSRSITVAGLAALAASPLFADFTYHQKATITGGAVAGMMKVAGVFSKQAREPVETTISVKGDRMVERTAYRVSIIDLNAGTITSADLKKKTYTVMTFEQMKQAMQQAQQKMQQHKSANDGSSADVKFKVSIKSTGASKQVSGMDAKETIVKMEMQATDQQSGQSGSMVITSDLWLAPDVPGYQEVRDFHKRMAEKIAWAGAGDMFGGRPDVAEGMAEARKEAAKLDGLPVFSTVVMGGEGAAGADSGAAAQPPAQQQQAKPSLGGLLGRGIGINKKKDDSSQPPPAAGSSNSGSLLEMTQELSGFSPASVPDAEFAIPAGFKQVETRGMQ